MTALIQFVTLLVVSRAAAEIVDLNCSDNATCIDNLTKEFVRSIRQQKTVRLFDYLTIEPLGRTTQARSSQGLLAKFLDNHAISFDWSDFTFRVSRPEHRSDAMELEVFEGKSLRDVTESKLRKSTSKVEESNEEKQPKRIVKIKRHRRHRRKKVLQALIPMMFGMKSAGTVIFAMAAVTALTMKAFIASKLALAVTVGMAMKRLYESYAVGVGLQNHPYLYSQYPIDFPSASSHAYSVSGVQQNYATPEMYSPSAMAHTHTHEIIQQNDATASQSQQAPTLQLINNTRASERWDGKNQLQRFLEPIVDGIKNFVDPIANVFYNAMPATFRGMTSEVIKAKSQESDEPITSASTIVEEKVKKPREILQPQPRNIAQRKMTNLRKRGLGIKPKKYTELNVDLDKLKHNKDFHDYIKTKKYKHNYPYTSYYPRVKHFTNPNNFVLKPNNNRLITYTRNDYQSSNSSIVLPLNNTSSFSFNHNSPSDWKPLMPSVNITNTFDFLTPNVKSSTKIKPSYSIKKVYQTKNKTSQFEKINIAQTGPKKIKILFPVTIISNTTYLASLKKLNVSEVINNKTSKIHIGKNDTTNSSNITNISPKNTTQFENMSNNKTLVRSKRDLSHINSNLSNRNASSPRNFNNEGRGLFDMFGFFDFLFTSDPVQEMIKDAEEMTKKVVKNTASSVPGVVASPVVADDGPPKYYLVTYDLVMFSLAVIEDFVNMNSAMFEHLEGTKKVKGLKKKTKKKYKKPITFERPLLHINRKSVSGELSKHRNVSSE